MGAFYPWINNKLDLFGKSPCSGSTSIGADDLSFVEFADLFNHDECKPIPLGHPNAGMNVRLQGGDWWEFTCTRQMTDNVVDNGGVDSGEYVTDNPIDRTSEWENKFSMELQCCDPADPECTEDRFLTFFSLALNS